MCPPLACTPSTGPHASPPIKIHPVLLTQSTPLLIYGSHSFSERAPPLLRSSGVVSCARRSWCMCGATHHRFAWCSTPPTADAYTTRSCFAGLPARFGHIILSCGVQYRGGGLRGCLTAQCRFA
ncbi:putative zinc finger protein [Candidatus Mancarchaeum acidiphilum]|uniref:Putative zinc finger protein n=1 Tax=Candidatus Mancarchaeum acidiphilum TaxID=1920749 RepID=A0A218NNS8_9ARCH|nr:putative zinc finger protein [Candidatus Mancarchaeum acidiphilum]